MLISAHRVLVCYIKHAYSYFQYIECHMWQCVMCHTTQNLSSSLVLLTWLSFSPKPAWGLELMGSWKPFAIQSMRAMEEKMENMFKSSVQIFIAKFSNWVGAPETLLLWDVSLKSKPLESGKAALRENNRFWLPALSSPCTSFSPPLSLPAFICHSSFLPRGIK